MKHTLPVTVLLVLFFFVAQLLGLGLLAATSDVQVDTVNETTTVTYAETAIGPRPEVRDQGAVIYLGVGIALGTLLILLLRRLRRGVRLWKAWYALAVVMTITVSLGVFLPTTVALLLAIVLAYLKLQRQNMIIHNLTELFMYAGLALLLAPLFTVFWAVVLLVLISLYDAYAVWYSKHMIRLAEFTTQANLFAGFSIPYSVKNKKTTIHLRQSRQEATGKITKPTATNAPVSKQVKNTQGTLQAILGGGDVVFALIFSGAVLSYLLAQGFTLPVAFLLVVAQTCIITIALALLFYFGKKGKYYPAMPFISAGCFIGFGLVWCLQLVFG